MVRRDPPGTFLVLFTILSHHLSPRGAEEVGGVLLTCVLLGGKLGLNKGEERRFLGLLWVRQDGEERAGRADQTGDVAVLAPGMIPGLGNYTLLRLFCPPLPNVPFS